MRMDIAKLPEDPLTRDQWLAVMYQVACRAESEGFIVEIERQPLTPLAMKHDAAAVRIWERE